MSIRFLGVLIALAGQTVTSTTARDLECQALDSTPAADAFGGGCTFADGCSFAVKVSEVLSDEEGELRRCVALSTFAEGAVGLLTQSTVALNSRRPVGTAAESAVKVAPMVGKTWADVEEFADLLIDHVHGQEFVWRGPGGVVLPDTPWRKACGNLGALLFFADDMSGLQATWETQAQGVRLPEVSAVRRGETVVGTIVFGGGSKDDRGRGRLRVRYRVVDSRARVLVPWTAGELWEGKALPERGALQLAIDGIVVAPDESSEGRLSVSAQILDTLSGNRLNLMRTLEIQ